MIVKRVSLLIATAALVLGAFALPAQAALRHIDGTVVSKNASDRTFRLTTQSGNTVRVKVTAATKFQRLSGFGALHKGLRIEVDAKTTSSGLVATQVETSGGGGSGGADDNGGGGGGGADDGPNHT
jgi:hypothetical protein